MTYRNLQEQVQKNKTDIEAWTNVQFTLNNMGITVLGRVDTSVDIPDKSYEYGDAYLVGTVDPYDIYIYTRTTDPNVHGTFINLGPLSIAGPQGPKGEQGKDGVDGYAPVIRYGAGLPIVESTDKNGYLYIDQQTSKLYTYNNGWNYVIDMKGPQGPQGIQGVQGATGTSLSIVAKLSSPSLLPTDFSSGQIPKNSAYLVDVNGVNHLYIIIGDQNDYSTWYWLDAGDFNLGSVIYKNEVFQSSINVTDNYNTNTGAIVTDTATNNMNNDLKSQIGDLEILATTDKSSLVNAINEVKNSAGASKGVKYYMYTIDGSKKWSYIASIMRQHFDKIAYIRVEFNNPSLTFNRVTITSDSTTFDTISRNSQYLLNGDFFPSSISNVKCTFMSQGLVDTTLFDVELGIGANDSTSPSVSISGKNLTSSSCVFEQYNSYGSSNTALLYGSGIWKVPYFYIYAKEEIQGL